MYSKEEMQEYEAAKLNEINWKVSSTLRGTVLNDLAHYFGFVYVAYLIKLNGIIDEKELKKFINKKVPEQRQYFLENILQDEYELAMNLAKKLNVDDCLSYLRKCPNDNSFRVDMSCGTPASISKLALKILQLDKNDNLADFGSGMGDFIMMAADKADNIAMYGVEINTYSYEISKIRAELFAPNVEVELGDMFAVLKDRKFKKIFSNYPFGMSLVNLQASGTYIKELHKRLPEIKRATSSDWIFNSLITDHMAEDGKAIAIMTNGSTWNSIDQKIREYYVKNGLVEMIIALPEKLFEVTAIPTTMIVFSRGNKKIRMIDAKNICEKGRRQNALTDDNIDEIISLIKKDGETSITVDNKKLERNDYVLNPSRYLEKTIEIKDGVEFGSLMKRITRGAQLKAEELDDLVSESHTDIQYLMLSNIQNGMVSEDLPYLKELDDKLKKYCIENNDLLLSKNGAPYKVAVAEVKEGNYILGNGNLFIIKLDEEKVNPYFIKAFLDSEAGTLALKAITVGTSIPNISAESLKKMEVPLPPIEEQNRIAELYLAKIDEIKLLQMKLNKAQSELKGIFGEVN